MKVAFYLTNNRNMRDGVTHYATEIINRLTKGGDFEYVGEAFLSCKDKTAAVREYFNRLTPGLSLQTVKMPIPMHFLHRFCESSVPFPYERLMKSRADIRIFFHNFIPKCPMSGKKVVVIHDLTPLHDQNASRRSTEKARANYLHAVQAADLIFTDSEYSRADIVKTFPEAEQKIRVVYCGMDRKRFSEPVAEEKLDLVRKKYGLGKEYLLFMGQARPNKNLPNLFRAYALLPENVRNKYALLLANHTPALEQLASELNIRGQTVLLGGIAEEDVAAIYHAARALALVSVSEGFGLPLVEAMAAGIPTVSSDASCLPEIAGGATRYVKADDPVSIAKGLEEVLTDEPLREKLIALGKERAAMYDWDEAAEKFLLGLKKL